MKFGSFKIIFTLAILGLVNGCAQVAKEPEIALVTDKTITPALMSTEQFLPYIKIDEETGLRLPYVPQPNPYLGEKGQLDKLVVSHFIEAKRAIKSKSYLQAENALKSIVEKNSTLSGPYVLLGDIKKLKKHSEDALIDYAKAIEINNNNVNAYIKLAKTQRELGLFKHAQVTYTKALKTWPDFPEAHLNLSILYDVYLNQPQIAQKHMEAYQLLAGGAAKMVTSWLSDIQQRTQQANYIEQDAKQKEAVILARIAQENKDNESKGGS